MNQSDRRATNAVDAVDLKPMAVAAPAAKKAVAAPVKKKGT
jgi:hypothetical protein